MTFPITGMCNEETSPILHFFPPQSIQESIMEAPTLDSQYNNYSYAFNELTTQI